ncbi:bacillithiol biosynthesis cysteine-adding enzyme BshC [Mucilaginibacter hurinus]|uniref:Putative cysteine ligase BshC n=1 Tax=Mucilaginibacter hurinus TaxID=2201324 RepID=A0A367GNR0_9SPHI|nr:bacillithiol biosynthesis cysteine-adding enzyme BshC [Mucilaginibacter hurinus]RCH54940.1 bacillithiol biosynthesis cysteine-adding enzyme BshC [Mucilaginibacter hurinus]
MEVNCISYKDTGFFSETVSNYLDDAPGLRPFYSYRPTIEGFRQILQTKNVIADRKLLVDILIEQYERNGIAFDQLPLQGARGLGEANTYTITTGHQLNIFAGPLYFIYKIVTAIKLSRQLKEEFPDKNFVPVYWMASEDHDFAEINYTNIGGKKVHWWYEAQGATGRINPDSMRQALNQYKGVLGMEGHANELAEIVETAYTKFDKLADATRYLVNALFGQYGLIVIDADDKRFKKHFAKIIEQDIIEQQSFKNIEATNKKLQHQGVDIQVNPREINFFYLLDGLRERITFDGGRYKVLNTEIDFSEEEIKQEIMANPERFSPNVVMRPVYQECILPNIAYVGGGAEIVYWLELKSTFDHYHVDFPILILRNSALIIPERTAGKIGRMKLSPVNLFRSTDEIKKLWVKAHSEHRLSLNDEWQELQSVFEKIKSRLGNIDPTLKPSAEAAQARLKHAIDNLEKKLVKAEKLNYKTRLEQIEQIKAELFPKNSLQERAENFGLFYVKWGHVFIGELVKHFEPLDFKFTVLTESN